MARPSPIPGHYRPSTTGCEGARACYSAVSLPAVHCMLPRMALAFLALTLSGCGVPDYFDQHHANVREVSAADDEDDTAAAPANPAVVTTSPLPPPVASQPPPVVANAPAPAPETAARMPAPAAKEQPVSDAPVLAAPAPPVAASAAPPPVATAPAAQSAASVAPRDAPAETEKPMVAVVPAPQDTASAEPPPVHPAQAPDPQATDDAQTVTTPAVAPVAPPPAPRASVAEPLPVSNCESVAAARASDAAANGYDDDMQKTIHDGVYADCVAWNKSHPGGS